MLYQLSYFRKISVGSDGFEPPKATPAELQSAPFGHSGNCPFRFFAVQRYELFVNCANGTAHFQRSLSCFGTLIA